MNNRRESILKYIVESYIKTVKPVGSKSLCKKLQCSSATIRNEMAKLEEAGYLEKNHISSGRIPSEKGYRYYVEKLMKPKELTGEDVLKLQTIFQNHELQLSDAINQCVEIISEITNYTSVVLGKKSLNNNLQQVSIVPISNNRIVAIVCTDYGIVQNKQFTLSRNVNINEIVETCEIINKMLIGTPIGKVAERLEYEIKPIIADRIKQYETVYNIFSKTFHDFANKVHDNVYVSGTNLLLDAPEYRNLEEVKTILSKFDDENFIKKIEASEDEEGVNIYIGGENEFDPNVTIIKTTFHRNGEDGTIAIIGPKRMECAKVVGLLSYINEELNKED